MSDLEEPAQPSRGNFFRRLEAWVGAALACLYAFLFLLAAIFISIAIFQDQHGSQTHFTAVMSVFLIGLIIEAIFILTMSEALRKLPYPFAPNFALSFARVPLVLRPLVGLWWIGHCAIGIGFTLMLETVLLSGAAYFGWNVLALRFLTFAAINFTLAYSSNMYIALTITACGGKERAVMSFWRWRLLVDVGVAVASTSLPLMTVTHHR